MFVQPCKVPPGLSVKFLGHSFEIQSPSRRLPGEDDSELQIRCVIVSTRDWTILMGPFMEAGPAQAPDGQAMVGHSDDIPESTPSSVGC